MDEPALAPLPAPPEVVSEEPRVVVGERVELTLPLDGEPQAPHAFWLDSPRRYVVDVLGRRSTLAHKTYEVGHATLSRVRVGQHPDKVRFVLEVADGVRDARVRVDGGAVVVSLSKP